MNNLNSTKLNQENLKIKVERLYVKEINCKLPHAPNLFESPEFKELQVEPSIEMNIKTQGVGVNKFEVTLHAIINGKTKNLSLFNLDVQQSGIFTIDVPQNQMENIIKNYCVPMLHPYLAHVISTTIIQAGLPPVILQPFQPIIDNKMNSNNSKISNLESIENIMKQDQEFILDPIN